MPFEPRRSTFWDQPLESQQPSPMRSNSPSLPAERSEIDKVMLVQPRVGAKRWSSKPQPEPWLANIWTANLTSSTASPTSSTANPTSSTANSTSSTANPTSSTANPTSSQRWAGWNPTAQEYYPSSSSYAPIRGASPTETLTTNKTPSSSPESHQGTDVPDPGPTNTGHDVNPTAVPPTAGPQTAVPPTAVPLPAVPLTTVPPTAVPPIAVPPTAVPPTAVPLTAVSLTAVPMTAVFMSAYPILPQDAVESAIRGVSNAATVLSQWIKNHPDAGPVRQVASQAIYNQQDQTLHQEELELRKRVEKEEAAMRARRARPLY